MSKKTKKDEDKVQSEGSTLNAYKEQMLSALHFLDLQNVIYRDVPFGTLFIKNVNGRVVITTLFKITARDFYSMPDMTQDRMGTGFISALNNLKDANELQLLTIPEKFDYEGLIIKERAKQLKSKSITRLNPKTTALINALNHEDKKALEKRYENAYIPTYYALHKYSSTLKPNQLKNENYKELINEQVNEAIEAGLTLMNSLETQGALQSFYIVSGQTFKDLISYTFSGLHLKQELQSAGLSTLNAIEEAKFEWDDKITSFLNELEYDLKVKRREIEAYRSNDINDEDSELEYMTTIYNINLTTYNNFINLQYERISDENGKPYTRLDFINDTK